MRPLSDDLRERIVARRASGESAASISKLFGVSIRSVQRYYRLQSDRGCVSAEKKGKPEGSKLDAHRDLVCCWVEREPGLTLEQLCDLLACELNVKVHHTTVMRVLRRWGYGYKKNDLCWGKGSVQKVSHFSFCCL